MAFTGLTPTWFLGFDAALEVLFLSITLLITGYAWRGYRLGAGDHLKRWSQGFFLISLGYAAKAVTHFLIYLEIIENQGLPVVTQLQEVIRLYNACFILHVALSLIGYLIILTIFLKISDTRLFIPFTLLVLATALGSLTFPWLFELILAALLVQIIVIMLQQRKKHTSQKLVIVGFVLIGIGQIAYLLLNFNNSYVAGHMFELLGFGCLAASMIIIMRRK